MTVAECPVCGYPVPVGLDPPTVCDECGLEFIDELEDDELEDVE
jgi:hypothetical protein